MSSVMALSSEEAKLLQADGSVKLPDGRVRKLTYYGNQYDSKTLIRAAKADQLTWAKVSQVAGGSGYVLTAIGTSADVYLYNKGDISKGRFIYRMTGNTAVIALSLSGYGTPAAAVGITHFAAEKFYDFAAIPAARQVYKTTKDIESGSFQRRLLPGFDLQIGGGN